MNCDKKKIKKIYKPFNKDRYKTKLQNCKNCRIINSVKFFVHFLKTKYYVILKNWLNINNQILI